MAPRQQSRRTVLKTIGALAVSSATLSGNVSAGIGDGRVADYHMNNLKGKGKVKDRVHDASPYNNHGTNYGSNVVKDGAVGNAFDFGAGKNHIEISDNDSLDIEDAITISFWFKARGENPDGQYGRPVSKGQSTSKNGAYGVFVQDTSNPTDIGLRFFDDEGNKHDVRDPSLPAYNDDLWHHVAATYSDSDDEGRLHVDKMPPIVEEIDGDVGIRTTDDDLQIGAGNSRRHFNGLIDEVRIYDRALTDGEIDELADQAYAVPPFLNEEALYKASPVWDTGVADATGQDEVDVLFGGMTDINAPFPTPGPEGRGPWGMDPRAVKVSPGTDVTWTWWDGEYAINAHHLVSFFDPPYDVFPNPFGEEGHDHEHPGGDEEFYVKEDLGESFTYTFDDVGTYLYFCIPHGIPKGVKIRIDGEPRQGPNLFGQRGAVKVVDD